MSAPLRAARLGWGATLLTAPEPVLHALARSSGAAPRSALVVLRILGARHLAQAAVEEWGPHPAVLRLGVAVDAVHALTTAVFAAADPRWRRAALTDTAVAATFSLAAALTTQRERGRP